MIKKFFLLTIALATTLSSAGPMHTPQKRVMLPTKSSTTVPLNISYTVDGIHNSEYLCSITISNPNIQSIVSWISEFDLTDAQETIALVCPAQYITSANNHIVMQNNDLLSSKTIDANKSLRIIAVIKNPNLNANPISNLTARGFLNSAPIPAAPVLNTITGNATNYTVSWNAISNATHYLLQQDTTNAFGNPVKFDVSTTSKAFQNQPAGTYYYRVQATNDQCTSPFSNVQSINVNVTPPPPLAPPTLSNTFANGVNTLGWTTISGATTYILQQSTDNFATNKQIFNGSGTSFSLSGLAAGTYAFRVKATNATTDGNWSNIVTVTIQSPVNSSYIVAGYYSAWSIYRNPAFHPLDINGSLFTHITYAFVDNDTAGNLTLDDPWADIQYTYQSSTNLPYWGNFRQLYELKQKYPNLKTLFSVGGWNGSNNFSAMAADPAARTNFVNQCIAFADKYHFDGIDIDWEYPGYADHNGQPADKQNFTLLLQQLYTAAKAHTPALLVSIAAPADSSNYQNMELNKIPQYLDWIGLMLYDFSGPWSNVTNHDSCLYNPAVPETNCNDTIKGYIAGGVPSRKLVMGIPFYGPTFANANSTPTGLFSSYSGSGSSTSSDDPGMRTLADILKNLLGTYTQYWDNQAQAAYLYNKNTHEFITYESLQSLSIKDQYIKNMNLGGVMVWEIGYDTRPEWNGMMTLKQGLS